eukprot:364137-Chlamydomonas_euryale.AAC.1
MARHARCCLLACRAAAEPAVHTAAEGKKPKAQQKGGEKAEKKGGSEKKKGGRPAQSASSPEEIRAVRLQKVSGVGTQNSPPGSSA